ncbi:MAG: extracellular solute-binding protein [Bifidobacteriaceae bacterium]|nr:extracellular solute-binding protein [Bifidobacteriaceae bacterium]
MTINWWSTDPALSQAATAFNAAHEHVQIKFEQFAYADYVTYLDTVVALGESPCLAQMDDSTLNRYLSSGHLADVTEHVSDARAEFPEWAWGTVSLGDSAFGVPLRSGTMALLYRADLFQQYGLEVPTTWAEFKAVGQKLRAADPNKYIANLPDVDSYSGYARQAGASWFSAADGAWQVTIDSPANAEVAEFWQSMVDERLVSTFPSWSDDLVDAWADGTVVAEVGAAWTAGLLESVAAGSSGNWAVAPMPKWGGSDAVGSTHGSALAVLPGCPHPKEAAEAAVWLATSPESVDALIDAGIYPASLEGQRLAAASGGVAFFGGQAIFEVFAAESPKVNPDWLTGPVMAEAMAILSQGLTEVSDGSSTIPNALRSAQAEMETAVQSY